MGDPVTSPRTDITLGGQRSLCHDPEQRLAEVSEAPAFTYKKCFILEEKETGLW